jgi:hypothetical protein
MASTSESGHKKNVANLQDLIAFCNTYPDKYKPSNPDLSLDALKSKLSDALNALEIVNQKLALHNNALEARQTAYKPLTPIVNKIVYASKAAALPELIIADIETIARKLKGMRKTPKVTPPPENSAEAHKYVSVSQLGFDDRIENFSKLIELMKVQTAYNPNEEELSITGLTALLENMKAANENAINAFIALSNARIARNSIMYDETKGLVKIGMNAKTYVKSIYGPSSPEYKQISKLRFTNIKS